MFANIYLNEVDKFIKHRLHIKYYFRYMDDSVLMVKTKEEAQDALKKIKQFLQEKISYNDIADFILRRIKESMLVYVEGSINTKMQIVAKHIIYML